MQYVEQMYKMPTADADTQSLAHTIPPSPHTAFNEAMGVQNEFEGGGRRRTMVLKRVICLP